MGRFLLEAQQRNRASLAGPAGIVDDPGAWRGREGYRRVVRSPGRCAAEGGPPLGSRSSLAALYGSETVTPGTVATGVWTAGSETETDGCVGCGLTDTVGDGAGVAGGGGRVTDGALGAGGRDGACGADGAVVVEGSRPPLDGSPPLPRSG